jgi:hypothetical protein
MRYTKRLFAFFFLISVALSVEFISINQSQDDRAKSVYTFCDISQSYNLSLSNETISIRNRYESSVADNFGLSPTSREYFTSTFVYKPFR